MDFLESMKCIIKSMTVEENAEGSLHPPLSPVSTLVFPTDIHSFITHNAVCIVFVAVIVLNLLDSLTGSEFSDFQL